MPGFPIDGHISVKHHHLMVGKVSSHSVEHAGYI